MNVRKNASSLSAEEWHRFLTAVVTLKHTFPPGSGISVYDMFVALHVGVTQLNGAQTTDGAHGGPAFLPWHREYLKRFEQALQSVDARVTLPYWNWGLGDDDDEIGLFADDRLGPLGAAGTFTVDSGYFARDPNALNPLGFPIRAELQRFGDGLQRNTALNRGAPWPTAASVAAVLALPTFNLFRPALEWPPHGIVHVRLGRDMSQMTSPNDPIFWLHHAQVDRIWAKWQRDHPGAANYNPLNTGGQGHRLTDPMWPWDASASETTAAGMAALVPSYPVTDVVTPEMVLDHRDVGYCYDDEEGCPCPERAARPTFPRWEEPISQWIGEEAVPTLPQGEDLTTLRVGEEGGPTTLRLGEEGSPTRFIGEGPTDPRIDDPEPFRGGDPRSPFGGF